MRIEIPESVQVTVRGLISRGVRAVSKSDTGHLIFTLTDGSTVDLGQVDGADGVTPHIGENRHWFIGTVDTGIVAEGQDGAPGTPGTPGKDGDPGADGAKWWLTDEMLMETQPDGTGFGAILPTSAFYGHSGAKPAAGDMALSTANGVVNYITAASGQQVTCLSTVLNLTGKAGADGYSPEAAVSKTGKVATITIRDKSGTTTVTVSDGEDGAPGKDGEPGTPGTPGTDGVTPHIGENKHWFIGTVDTGVAAEGQDGADGATWYTGQDYPADAKNGDLWLYTGTQSHPDGFKLGDVAEYDGSGWDVLTNIRGAAGSPGTDGTPGAKWFVQESEPESNVNAGDLWLNTITYDVYWTSSGDVSGVVNWKYKGNIKGAAGTPGAKGDTPVITATKSGKVTTIKADGVTIATVSDGADGTNGTNGTNGKDGADGHTPVKGTDYWTAADQASMVQDVLAALPTWTGGRY